MKAFLIILAVYAVGGLIVKWAEKPSKRNPKPLNYPTKSIKEIKSVTDLVFPKLS